MALYLTELDRLLYKGKEYIIGEDISFNSDEEVDNFLANSHIVRREYKVYPPLFCLFGGLVKKKVYNVWVRN